MCATGKSKAMLQLIQEFIKDFKRSIEGSEHIGNEINTVELCGGARISQIFHSRLPLEMTSAELEEMELRRSIAMAIQNTHGVRVGLFTPDQAFEVVVKRQINLLKEPALACVDLVTEELVRITKSITEKLAHNPRFREEIDRIVMAHLREREQSSRAHIVQLIDVELAYINISHEDFIGFTRLTQNAAGQPVPKQKYRTQSLRNVGERIKEPEAGEVFNPQLESQVQIIRDLVDSYMRIVRKNIRDMVPKTLMYSLINAAKDFVESELIPAFYYAEVQNFLMEENVQEIYREEISTTPKFSSFSDGWNTVADLSADSATNSVPPSPVDVFPPTASLYPPLPPPRVRVRSANSDVSSRPPVPPPRHSPSMIDLTLFRDSVNGDDRRSGPPLVPAGRASQIFGNGDFTLPPAIPARRASQLFDSTDFTLPPAVPRRSIKSGRTTFTL